MAPTLPAPDLVERFRSDLEALRPSSGPLGVAYSGGPDSLALLLLAAAAWPGAVRAATVDHRLRPGSAPEAALAGRNCAALGVPHQVLTVSVPQGASRQALAREARYAALAAWMNASGVPTLLTAHHLDDQAETLMMRLLRGSGVGGLAGIRARRRLEGRMILRPLLAWRRSTLAQVAAASGLEIAQDPTNQDASHDRVRIRKLLAGTVWLDPEPLARSAAALADAEDALEILAALHFAEGAEERGEGLLVKAARHPPEIARRLLLKALARFAPEAAPRGEQVMALLKTLEAGGTATLAGVKFVAAAEGWWIAPAPPRR
jgi:tRNA(Ile)-lysidine synthase